MSSEVFTSQQPVGASDLVDTVSNPNDESVDIPRQYEDSEPSSAGPSGMSPVRGIDVRNARIHRRDDDDDDDDNSDSGGSDDDDDDLGETKHTTHTYPRTH